MEKKHHGIRHIGQRVIFLLIVSIILLMPTSLYADEQLFYYSNAVNAGLDTGYSEEHPIEESDPHFGWSLGSFYISGFTSVQRDDETVTFLKTSGDTVALHFRLDQNINQLNGDESLIISNDSDGYDERLGIEKSENGFGRGTLIVRQTDYQNNQLEPQVYVDFLTGLTAGADTEVELFEEGDYEVVLNYEIKQDRKALGLIPLPPDYRNYTIRFSFSVRNGNTMAFLFDAETGDELTNASIADNGFVIDLAQSRYLEINITRETLSANGHELVEDVRYNGPAKDGERYTEPGIYTITVTNPTTLQSTEKVICVGDDEVLRAYATTDYSIEEIQTLLAQGATISETGDILWNASQQSNTSQTTPQTNTAQDNDFSPINILFIVLAVLAFSALCIWTAFRKGLVNIGDAPWRSGNQHGDSISHSSDSIDQDINNEE